MKAERGFEAWEYQADDAFRRARFDYVGDEAEGWIIRRDGEEHLRVGPGYRLVDVAACGVCSTDLARRFLPFPLPQVIGHETVLRSGTKRYVAEINASCLARRLPELCSFCAEGLATHCPERMVLGIDRLPGGFGDALLAPREALIEIPESLPDLTAVLVEPFAAALHGVEIVAPREGERVAVLGPRRLGMLVLAALAAWREREGRDFEIIAAPRRAELSGLAQAMGADRVVVAPPPTVMADVVIDTTGAPQGLELALALARREVHLKSTHGQPAAGLNHLTELVVDELRIAPERAAAEGERRVYLDAEGEGLPAQALAHRVALASAPLGRADTVVATTPAAIDLAIRPDPKDQIALLRPRGEILIPSTAKGDGVIRAVADRGVHLTSSRCGDFRAALSLLDANDEMRALGERFVTHRFSRGDLPEAFRVAGSPECVKAVVED